MADDWKFAVEDFEDETGEESASRTSGGRATDVFGEASGLDAIEPGSPSFENIVFVLVGVALALLVILGV